MLNYAPAAAPHVTSLTTTWSPKVASAIGAGNGLRSMATPGAAEGTLRNREGRGAM